MYRFLPLLALAFVAAAATAQPVYDRPVYNGLDDDLYQDARPGVRVGLGVGPYIYSGPNILVGSAANQRDVIDTNIGVTGEVSFPLAGNLYGRVLGGVLNIGADDDAAAPGIASDNPFLTSITYLAEGDLMYYLTTPGQGFSPYVFSGISGLFASGDGGPGVETSALAIPVGLGFEYGLSRNLSLYAEGSYRFGLTEVGTETGFASASLGPDVCDKKSDDYDEQACRDKGGTPIPTCDEDPSQERCREVINGGDRDFRTRFNSGLITGGLRLGFGGAPAPRVPVFRPDPVPPVQPVPPAPPVIETPLVCDLVELNSVYFDYGTGSLDRRGRALLDENVDLLLSNPACCVFIDGYTDTSEGDRFGMSLAGRRAQAVYDYYLSRGVSASRLQIRNRGVAVPACDKEDPGPGCERNRRVESLPVDCERFQFLLENPSYDQY